MMGNKNVVGASRSLPGRNERARCISWRTRYAKALHLPLKINLVEQ